MTLHNPHDRFFKLSFGDPAVAAEFLKHYLPADLLDAIDLSTLEPEEGSFVDEELAEQQTDLLYSVRLNNGSAAHLYFLFEHKSYPDRWVILQLLGYMVKQWQAQAKVEQMLSPIIPILIYHGEQAWRFPADFHAYVEKIDGLEAYVPRFSMLAHDFSAVSTPEIRGELLLRTLLTTLMRVKDRNFKIELDRYLEMVFELEILGRPHLIWLRSILYYIVEATDSISNDEFKAAVKKLGPKGERHMPTIAMQMRQEAREEGLEEGRVVAYRTMILNTLQIRFKGGLGPIRDLVNGLESVGLLDEASQEAVRCDSLDGFAAWLLAQKPE